MARKYKRLVFADRQRIEEMRRQAMDIPEMTLEEINEEIRLARDDQKTRKY